jgi:cysteine-rich repeat protein
MNPRIPVAARFVVCLSLIASLPGCPGPATPVDGGEVDGAIGSDAGPLHDGGPAHDGGPTTDAARDTGPTPDVGPQPDTGMGDAATYDAGMDAAITPPDAGSDAGNDGGSDAGPPVDAWMASCGNGTVDPGEVCDDGNLVSGDGCDMNCRPTACGNGVVTTGEHCDDGNTTSGDGCHADCVSETEIEPNDDGTPMPGGSGRVGNDFDAVAVSNADANGLIHDTFVMHAAWAVAGDEDVFALDNAGDTAEVFTIETSETPTTCTIDTVITVRDATGAQLAQDDDGGTDFCSLLRYTIPAHTRVYVHVTAYGDNDTTAAYLIYFSLCGDAAMGPGEVCDDGNAIAGDACDPNCTVPACGNAVTDPTETCDDGNVTNGDGCDSNCTMTACGNGIRTTGEACDDGNATNGDGCDTNCTVTACGNGVVSAPETCDDGNATDGDGCDHNCTPTSCGNGIVTAGEACDDGNTVAGDGCENDCTISPSCGNGILNTGETCDDGGMVSGDGCSSACAVEAGWMCSGMPSTCAGICGDGMRVGAETCDDGNTVTTDCCVSCAAACSTMEVEPNDSAATALPITSGATGGITAGDHDYYAITLTGPSNVRIETFDGTGGACTGVDTFVTLYRADGTTVVASDDDGGIGACSLIDPATVVAARALPAGTYYVMVRAFSATAVIPTYDVRVTITASGCGDSFLNTGEECDDGNVTAGDGCSATCTFEAARITEVEPNDDGTPMTGGTGIVGNDINATAVANANANGAITASTIVSGALNPAGDEDLFAISNPGAAPVTVHIETGAPTIGTCPSADTGLRVLDATLAVITTDDDGGPGACSSIATVTIPAGTTYYVQVVEFGDNATIAAYQLYVRFM